jgi:hypothetical protein
VRENVTPYRERDIRNQIHDLLEQTGAFDGVYLAGLPEDRGEPSGDRRSVSIEPGETTEADLWDDTTGDLIMTCRVNLTFLARHENPQIRDETAEQLLNIAASALNGQSLAGATLVGQTRIRSWSWERPNAPERRIAAVLEYQYLVSNWAGLNTVE